MRGGQEHIASTLHQKSPAKLRVSPLPLSAAARPRAKTKETTGKTKRIKTKNGDENQKGGNCYGGKKTAKTLEGATENGTKSTKQKKRYSADAIRNPSATTPLHGICFFLFVFPHLCRLLAIVVVSLPSERRSVIPPQRRLPSARKLPAARTNPSRKTKGHLSFVVEAPAQTLAMEQVPPKTFLPSLRDKPRYNELETRTNKQCPRIGSLTMQRSARGGPPR